MFDTFYLYNNTYVIHEAIMLRRYDTMLCRYNVVLSTPNSHSARVGTYGLNPILRGDPSSVVGYYGLFKKKVKLNFCIPSKENHGSGGV